jgi:hypothetical protein
MKTGRDHIIFWPVIIALLGGLVLTIAGQLANR